MIEMMTTMTMTMVEGEYVYGALTVTTPAESLLTSFFVHHIIPNVFSFVQIISGEQRTISRPRRTIFQKSPVLQTLSSPPSQSDHFPHLQKDSLSKQESSRVKQESPETTSNLENKHPPDQKLTLFRRRHRRFRAAPALAVRPEEVPHAAGRPEPAGDHAKLVLE